MRGVGTDIGMIHFVGIGGIGMSGIAEVMHNLGYAVQGRDIAGHRRSLGRCRKIADDSGLDRADPAIRADPGKHLADTGGKHLADTGGKRGTLIAERSRIVDDEYKVDILWCLLRQGSGGRRCDDGCRSQKLFSHNINLPPGCAACHNVLLTISKKLDLG